SRHRVRLVFSAPPYHGKWVRSLSTPIWAVRGERASRHPSCGGRGPTAAVPARHEHGSRTNPNIRAVRVKQRNDTRREEPETLALELGGGKGEAQGSSREHAERKGSRSFMSPHPADGGKGEDKRQQ